MQYCLFGAQVQSVPAPTQAPSPGDTCSHDVEVVPPLGTDQPGGAPPKQQQGIREVQVSMALMDEFLKCAPQTLFPILCIYSSPSFKYGLSIYDEDEHTAPHSGP